MKKPVERNKGEDQFSIILTEIVNRVTKSHTNRKMKFQ